MSVAYRELSVDPLVEAIMKKFGCDSLVKPIMFYEQCGRLGTAIFKRLGCILTGKVKFLEDPSQYFGKLIACDRAITEAADRVIPDPISQAQTDDLVHALYGAVMACVEGTDGASDTATRGGGEINEDLKELLGYTKKSTVRKEDVLGHLTVARKAGVDVPLSEAMRPGHKVLGLFADSLKPKQSTVMGAPEAPVSFPLIDVEKVDSEAGTKVLPKGIANQTAASVVGAYKQALLAALIIGHDQRPGKDLHPYVTGESEHLPHDGHRLMDAPSVKVHVAPIDEALGRGLVSGATMSDVIKSVNAAVRQHVNGGSDMYSRRLTPSAALRAVAGDMRKRLEMEESRVLLGTGKGDGARGTKRESQGEIQESPERAAQRESRRLQHEANRVNNLATGRGGRGGKGRGAGYSGRGAGGGGRGSGYACRDFAVGRCQYGDACKFSHAAVAQVGAPGLMPPMMGPPPPFYGQYPPPYPPPGFPPPLALMPPPPLALMPPRPRLPAGRPP